MTNPTSFGQWLKQRRKALDLTQEALAGRIGCTANLIYKIEADVRRPSRQIAELLAEHLNVPANERNSFVRFARGEVTEYAVPWGTPFQPPNNLPAQPTVLIGRDEDVTAIRRRLLQPETRLLTLIGPPGIGKTRLAIQVASEVLDNFADGVFLIPLAPITDANLVSTTIANTLGVANLGPRTPQERLKVFLSDKEMLVVLDNFEQILGAAPQIAELLGACPLFKVLVTSRAPLRIRQERQLPITPLELPDLAQLPDVETISHYSAITLFLERAQAVKPDFSLTEDNASTVAAICTRLDGLPLAIELISARVKLLSPAALLERLHGRLMLKSDGLRDIEPRHRTLNAAIEWSFQLLNSAEQTLFWRLGIFVGGWTLEAAEAVCTENLELNILDGMASLLDKNLVKQDLQFDSEPRFIMLETIREYTLERLVASRELESLQRQHADYFLHLAENPAPTLNERQMRMWWDRLELEHANFRAALTWSQTEETGLRLALALTGFWMRRGYLSEGRGWFVDLMAQRERGMDADQAIRRLWVQILESLGVICLFQDDLDAAERALEECLALSRELGDTAAVIEVLSDYGVLFHMRGDFEQANTFFQESLELSRVIGNSVGIRKGIFFLGSVAYSQGDVPRARGLLEEALTMMRVAGDIWFITAVLRNLAMIALDEGDYGQARVYGIECLTRTREMDERWQLIYTLEVFASLAALEERHSNNRQSVLIRSARLFGGAEALREIFGAAMMEPHQRRLNERGLALLRAQLDAKTLAPAWAEGRAMTIDQVTAYALEDKISSI